MSVHHFKRSRPQQHGVFTSTGRDALQLEPNGLNVSYTMPSVARIPSSDPSHGAEALSRAGSRTSRNVGAEKNCTPPHRRHRRRRTLGASLGVGCCPSSKLARPFKRDRASNNGWTNEPKLLHQFCCRVWRHPSNGVAKVGLWELLVESPCTEVRHGIPLDLLAFAPCSIASATTAVAMKDRVASA